MTSTTAEMTSRTDYLHKLGNAGREIIGFAFFCCGFGFFCCGFLFYGLWMMVVMICTLPVLVSLVAALVVTFLLGLVSPRLSQLTYRPTKRLFDRIGDRVAGVAETVNRISDKIADFGDRVSDYGEKIAGF